MSSIMNTNNKSIPIYRVVGRYMTGSAVVGYHLVGSDGSQVKASKERVIYMIGKGLVENMRVQSLDTEIILRGKGVNLNTLPIYDLNKDAFRDGVKSQEVANTNVKPKRDSGVNPMGQMEIIKRIMYKTNCLGYILKDRSGKEMKLSRDKIIDLGVQRLLSNATVQKYTDNNTGETKLILRGVGCDLTELPSLIVDETGKIIDINKTTDEIRMRIVRMKRGGIVYDKGKDKRLTFEAGDYLICGKNAVVRPIKHVDLISKFEIINGENSAVCDNNLVNLENYPIELFGNKVQMLTPQQVINWQVVRAV